MIVHTTLWLLWQQSGDYYSVKLIHFMYCFTFIIIVPFIVSYTSQAPTTDITSLSHFECQFPPYDINITIGQACFFNSCLSHIHSERLTILDSSICSLADGAGHRIKWIWVVDVRGNIPEAWLHCRTSSAIAPVWMLRLHTWQSWRMNGRWTSV